MLRSYSFHFLLTAIFTISTQALQAQNAEENTEAVKTVFSHPLPELVILSSRAEGKLSVATDSRTGTTVQVTVENGVPVGIAFFDQYANALPPGDTAQCNSVVNPTFTQQCLAGEQVLCQPIPSAFEDCFCTCTAP